MRYRVRVRGLSPIICHNGAAGLDTRSAANIEMVQIARRRGFDRTEADEVRLRELGCYSSLYLDEGGAPTFPASAFRANIEAAARKLRQGAQVREGLIVEEVEVFDYDRALGTTGVEVARNAQFTVGVRVRQARVLRTPGPFRPLGCHVPGGYRPRVGGPGTAAGLVGHRRAPSRGGGLAAAEIRTHTAGSRWRASRRSPRRCRG